MNILITGNIASGKSCISNELIARGIVERWRYYSIDELRRRFSDGTFSGEYYAWSLFFRAAQTEIGGLFEFSGVGRNAPVIRDIVRDSVEQGNDWRIISCNAHVDTIARRLSDKSTDLPLPYRIGKSKKALFESALHANQHILDRLETGYWYCPELCVDTDRQQVDGSVEAIIQWLNIPISAGSHLVTRESIAAITPDQRLYKQQEWLDLFVGALEKAGKTEVTDGDDVPFNSLREITNSLAGGELEKGLRTSFFERIGRCNNPKNALNFAEAVGLRAVFFRYLRNFESDSWMYDYDVSLSILERIKGVKFEDSAVQEILILFALLYPGFLVEDKYPVKIPRQIRDIQERLIEMDVPTLLEPNVLDGVASCIVGVKLLKLWSTNIRRGYSDLNYSTIGRGHGVGLGDFKAQLSKLSCYQSGLLTLVANFAGYSDVFRCIAGGREEFVE